MGEEGKGKREKYNSIPMNLMEAADANFAVHATWALRSLSGATVIDTPELVIADSGLTSDTFNVICRARLSVSRAPSQVAAALEHFRSTGRPFSWWSGPADQPSSLRTFLAEQGLKHLETELTMSADLRVAPPESPAGGLEIRRVRTAGDLRALAGIVSQGSEEVARFYLDTSTSLLSRESPQRFYLGYLEGEPVCAAELALAAGVAGIYGVVTLERFRRRGFGTAMTRHAMMEARDSGCPTAILQATAAGAGIYARLGFKAYGEVREFKP
jgi:ribosomal protein S18 acetylase RimI-like enzyme